MIELKLKKKKSTAQSCIVITNASGNLAVVLGICTRRDCDVWSGIVIRMCVNWQGVGELTCVSVAPSRHSPSCINGIKNVHCSHTASNSQTQCGLFPGL